MLPAATIVRNDSPVSGGCPAYAESPTLAPSPGAVDMHTAEASGGCGTLPPSLSALPHGARRSKPLSAQTTRPLSGTPGHATAYHGCYPPRPALARALVRLASGAGGGATGDVSPLASAGIPPVLAVEVPIRTTTDPCGP